MNILFVHQNFPGQFRHLAPALAAAGHTVLALNFNGPSLEGITTSRYTVQRGTTPNAHPWVLDFETKMIRAEACARTAEELRQQGFQPDVIVAHMGWGEGLLLKHVWPKARLLGYLEFFYKLEGADVGFDPEHSTLGWESASRIQIKNAGNLLGLEAIDWGLSPTRWQKHTHPKWIRDRVSVIFDGIDTQAVAPNPGVKIRLDPTGQELSTEDEVITFVSRNLEPYRGIHSFLRALPEIQRQRPKAVTLIVGGDGVSYGAKPPDGTTWRTLYLNEVQDQLDLSRVHFLGTLPYANYLSVLQISSCHVYLTYPFVLSWSMLEAMSAGCLVVGSRTPPVEEVLKQGVNGLLADFLDPESIAKAVVYALEHPERMRTLRAAARATVVQGYDLRSVCLPRQMALVQALGMGALPAG